MLNIIFFYNSYVRVTLYSGHSLVNELEKPFSHSIIQFHKTLIMKVTIDFLLLLGEMGAIVAPTYFQVPIIAFLPFFCFFWVSV